jgi:phosphoribosylformylglycinamidine cyclo-ligase
MLRTFNCGIGYVLVVAAAEADAAMRRLSDAGEPCLRIGAIRSRATGDAAVSVV